MVRVGKTGTIQYNIRKEELCSCFVGDDGNKVAKKDLSPDAKNGSDLLWWFDLAHLWSIST